ncbi:MAG TPA: CotS family spore coat protein, partial [Prolixibacteraceae bacterium]
MKYVKPLRAVNLADTDRGKMIIKEAARDPDKILFIHGLKEHLYKNGFETIDRYLLTGCELPFAIIENRIFVMERYIDGRECSFTNPFDRENAVYALGSLHCAGRGYSPVTGAAKRDNLGKWKNDTLKKINYLIRTESVIREKRKKDSFDKAFLKDVKFAVYMAWRSFDTLNGSDYEGICERAERDKVICHHDYTYHNILLTENDDVNVIDFDYSCHELPIYDLACFIMKIMKRHSYDIDMALRLIDIYSHRTPITKDDMMLMLSIFEFPQRFWRICDRYYGKKTDWSHKVFREKYNDITTGKRFILDFTEAFR